MLQSCSFRPVAAAAHPSDDDPVHVTNEIDKAVAQYREIRRGLYYWLLWAPAQRKRATMLYFANVFLIN